MTKAEKGKIDSAKVAFKIRVNGKLHQSGKSTWGVAQDRAMLLANKLGCAVELFATEIRADRATFGPSDEHKFTVIPSDWKIVK